ncbi:hypothetical protein GGP53_002827 [Salinibacter ruber]|uniref:sulfotransferase domain-containing protein n=1 Tax=Salinibacter ruber TaxID=146919 RepID=UPI00216A03D9|nr:sulfotransferase domain-containing protein [Salinibacter ruber]MCS3628948.1 hypothetical protein [Salinibacter ruber]MCS4145857.1 hypothetical protein [Salinibacter ruber]
MDKAKILLPDFFVCGAPKAGATSLYRYLSAHPDIFMSSPKEPWFFQGDDYNRGLEWYSETWFSGYEGEEIVGEATPGYMGDEAACSRIARDLPSAKVIFLLRDPVERLWSEYWWRIQFGRLAPSTSFGEFVRRDDAETNAFGVGHITLGLYYQHLVRWEDAFGRDQMHVLLTEDLAGDRRSALNGLFRFLGVEERAADLENLHAHGATNHPKHVALYTAVQKVWTPIQKMLGSEVLEKTKSLRGKVKSLFFRSDSSGRQDMKGKDRAYLSDVYAEPNGKLANWLGRDLSHWT